MSKKVLVTGATGLLGRQVVKAFQRSGWSVTGTGFTRANPPSLLKLDLIDEGAINKILDEVKPQVVIHSAAQRFPDKCNADPASARALNTTATRALATASSSRSIILIYISTDYVFAGTEGEAPYEIDSPTSPPNLYGETKRDGETAVLESTANTPGLGVVLRVPVLYGEAETPAESAINVLIDVVRSQSQLTAQQGADAKPVNMDDWSIRYPTNTEDVARVLRDIAQTYLSSSSSGPEAAKLPRILQFSGEERFTKYEICQLFAQDVLGIPLDGVVANKEGNDPKAAVQRPFDTHLSTKALKDIGVNVESMRFVDWWKRELKAYKR
ncbi:MAG: hypothetical protein M4579_001527 [Chaenotheca gracillima]|nr:MAG: hypothetical protein M4579_001527 [Chaenotheca gracillima]